MAIEFGEYSNGYILKLNFIHILNYRYIKICKNVITKNLSLLHMSINNNKKYPA